MPNQVMDNDSPTISFPLFHGTSSHYLTVFKPGTVPTDWSYKGVTLGLLRDVWAALRDLGREPEWWVERILEQHSGYANWQHGELYVTPSKLSAVRYAGGGAVYGGELLTLCRSALDELVELDRERAKHLVRNAEGLARFLNGAGLPILVEFANVRVCDISMERESDDVRTALSLLDSELMLETLGQQTNFRLIPGRCTVSRVFELEITDIKDPLTSFGLRPICDSKLWD